MLLDKIYQYLDAEEDDGLKYYEFLSDETYNSLRRDDFLEVLVTARFSKMKELSDSIQRIAELASVFETITDQQLLDKKANEAIAGFSALGQLKSGKEISCVFEFDDKKFPLIAFLDDSFLDVPKKILWVKHTYYAKLYVKFLKVKALSLMRSLMILKKCLSTDLSAEVCLKI